MKIVVEKTKDPYMSAYKYEFYFEDDAGNRNLYTHASMYPHDSADETKFLDYHKQNMLDFLERETLVGIPLGRHIL